VTADHSDPGRARRGWSGGSRRRQESVQNDPDLVAEWSRAPKPPTRPMPRYPWQEEEPPTYRTAPPPPRHEPRYEEQTRRQTPPPPPQQEHRFVPPEQPTSGPRTPKKLTVTRVAMFRSRQLGQRGVDAFRRALHADGADQSGLAALTWAVMMNYATDATLAVALANTLFFSAATGESQGKVALYLLITVAPFAVIAPVIGPMLDRIQHGRRLALAVSCFGQALLAVVMALHFDDWGLYPAALGTMVLSKSFNVLKAAVTPRVLPPDITLVKTNARLTVFGLAAAGVFGAVAVGFAKLFNSPGALWFTAILCVANAVLCLRIPAWVEVTEGEVPTSLRAEPKQQTRQPLGRQVVMALWGNGTIRVLTGFLTLFAAFVIKAQTERDHAPFEQILLLGMIGAAAGLGNFLGNGIGARLQFGRPDQVIIGALSAILAMTVVAALIPGVPTVVALALVGAVGSALAKISLDATIQDDLPEESRASAFGRSETILQFGWVFGGALGVLLPAQYWVGFAVVGLLLAAGLAQTVMVNRDSTLLPWLGRRRPLKSDPVTRPSYQRPSPGAAPPGP
jgi:Major Facilitator Superfamily